MFSIQIQMDASAADARIAGMMEKIVDTATVQMPREFVEWQENDMKRDHANVSIQGWSVMTSIWPTSRRKMVAKKRRKFEPRRALRGLRPILRQDLFDALCARMEGMLNEFVTWRKGA